MKSESVRTAISITMKNKISLGEINKDELTNRFPGTAGCVHIHKNGTYKIVSKEIFLIGIHFIFEMKIFKMKHEFSLDSFENSFIIFLSI